LAARATGRCTSGSVDSGSDCFGEPAAHRTGAAAAGGTPSCERWGLDGYAASHRPVLELKADGTLPANTRLRSSKYSNNLIEEDYRGVKQRIAIMPGCKGFRHAAITIVGIELMHRISKSLFTLPRLGVRGGAVPAIWNTVLQA
jgi:hypothetical protein